MKVSLITLAMTGTLALALSATVKAQLVVNGGFETGDFTGWTQSGNTGATGVSSNLNYIHSGTFGAQLGPVGSDGFLSQDLTTSVGTTYELSYWMNSDGGLPNDFSATLGSTTLFSASDIPSQPFTNYVFDYTATSTTTTLQFGFRNDPSYLALDDVSVTPTPEPGSIALLIGMSVSGAGFLVRRRRNARKAA